MHEYLNFSIMLNVIMLNVIMLNVIMLNVIMLNVIMLNVIMLNVIMLNVNMLSAMSPFKKTNIVTMRGNQLPISADRGQH